MKCLVLVLLSSMQFAFASTSANLDCQWLNTGFEENFYRPAQFNISINKSGVLIHNDSFFSRGYTPCWIGNFESCRFEFEIPKEEVIAFEEISKVGKNFSVGFESAAGYGYGVLDFNFSKNVWGTKKGESVELSLNGDDGDGVFINNHEFICIKK